MVEEIKNTMLNFIVNTISGMESGLYKFYSQMGGTTTNISMSNDVLKLKTNVVGPIINKYIIDYLNRTYCSIILKDDEYIVETFNNIEKHNSHSLVCILLMIGDMFKIIFLNIDRSLFNINSYSEYMASVMLQLYLLKNIIDKSFHLDHTCSGENIYDLDPNKPLFSTTPLK